MSGFFGIETIDVNVTGLNTTTGLSVVNDTETITVTSAGEPVLTTIMVEPETATLNVSETQQFTATAKDQLGNERSGIAFEWSSSNEAVGTIDANGLFTALADGDTRVKAENGTVNGTAEVTVTSGAPDIISFAPASPVSDTEGATRTFNITVNQIVNVSWYINGTPVQYNNTDGVTEASYTNDSAVIGTWNVSAIASNANGSDMRTWIWKVIEAGAAPTANYLEVEDASGRSGTYVEVPVSVTNVMNGPVLGIGFDISYDKNVINVTNVSKGNRTSDWADPSVNNNFTWGTKITIAGFHADDAISDGTSDSVVLLNFSVIGSPGDTSPMNMTLIELANPDGITGTAPAKNGTFTVTLSDASTPTPSNGGGSNGGSSGSSGGGYLPTTPTPTPTEKPPAVEKEEVAATPSPTLAPTIAPTETPAQTPAPTIPPAQVPVISWSIILVAIFISAIFVLTGYLWMRKRS